jgi:hypothetical protein
MELNKSDSKVILKNKFVKTGKIIPLDEKTWGRCF